MQEEQTANSSDTTSIWFGTFVPPIFPSLGGKARTEVCVVGAGISGLSTAYMLMKARKKVIVLDRGPLGGGETGRSIAHLTAEMDDRIYRLEQVHGPEITRTIVQSRRAAIDKIEEIVRTENIDCDFQRVDGYLVLGGDDSEQDLDEELAAAHRAGLVGVSKLPGVPASEFEFGPALRFPDQAQFHALKYLAGLASAIVLGGGRIYTDSRVVRVDGGNPCTVETENGHRITADTVCVCTNAPIDGADNDKPSDASCRSFTIAATVPRDSVPPALYCETGDPSHSVRIQPLPTPKTTRRRKSPPLDALIVDGEDAAPDDATGSIERWQRLETWMRVRWPQAGDVIHRWSRRVFDPGEHVVRVGPHPGGAANVYIATGDAGQGMTHGTINGMLLSDLVCGRDNALRSIYDLNRG